MRIPKQINVPGGTNPTVRAGALFIEIRNTSGGNLGVLFEGAATGEKIILATNTTRIFNPIGAQGYASFTLDDGAGGPSGTAVIIIVY